MSGQRRVYAALLVVKNPCLTQEELAKRLEAANEGQRGDEKITRMDVLEEETEADHVILYPPDEPFMWVSVTYYEHVLAVLGGDVADVGIRQPILV